jgi:hypothetical protein
MDQHPFAHIRAKYSKRAQATPFQGRLRSINLLNKQMIGIGCETEMLKTAFSGGILADGGDDVEEY